MTSPFGDPTAVDTMTGPPDQADRPSGIGYWLGGLLIAGGIVGGIAWGVINGIGFNDAIDDFERVPVGQVGTIELDEGDYVVYAERGRWAPAGQLHQRHPHAARRGPRAGARRSSSRTTPRSSPTTSAVAPAGPSSRSRSRTPASTRSAPTTARAPRPPPRPSARRSPGDLVSAIVGAFVIAIGGIVLGIILIVVTGIRRRKWRQRSWRAGAGGMAYGNQPGMWNPGAANAPQGAWGAPAPPGYTPPPPPGGGYPPPPG